MTLREMRQNAGYSRTKAGAKMNVCESTLAHWELGDWRPTDKYVKMLSKLYGVTITDVRAAIESGLKTAPTV